MKQLMIQKKSRLQGAGYALLILVQLFGVLQATTSYAITPGDLNSFQNDTAFYDPNAVRCSASSASTLNGYTLPAAAGKTGEEQAIDNQGKIIGGSDNGKPIAFADLAAKSSQPYRDYYITMRWSYASWNWDGTSVMKDQAQTEWMKAAPRLVLVTNTSNGKSIIAAALEAGPAPWTGVDSQPNNTPKEGWVNPQTGTPAGYTGRVSGLPPKAIAALGAVMGTTDGKGDILAYSWAPNQSATPGPVAEGSVSSGIAACGGGPGGTVFISQRDPKWNGQNICWTDPEPGCASVYDEGCWATSMAMIISTFTGRAWPNVVTPMQTEGHQSPHIDFNTAGLQQIAYSMTPANFTIGLNAVRNGALLFIHGTYGDPFYQSGNHWEVVRGVSPDGQSVYVNDPWDVPANGDSSQPNQTQAGSSGPYTAHTLTSYPISDFYHSSDKFVIIKK